VSIATSSEQTDVHGAPTSCRFHQHFFCVRMDPVIDDQEGGGSGLIVSEVRRAHGLNV
jgi:Cu2+-containing amine oxidase